MNLSPDKLKTIPLFRGLDMSHLDRVAHLFAKHPVSEGDTLFTSGEKAHSIFLLTKGEVKLFERESVGCGHGVEGGSTQISLVVKPTNLIGELHALTGLARNATCMVSGPSEIWSVKGAKLRAFFAEHPGIALFFQNNLLEVLAVKAQRDKRHMDQMRENLIRTQKSMKELRDWVFANPETPLSKHVCEALSEHIQKNRRAGYRVVPPVNYNAYMCTQERKYDVLELSAGYIKIKADSQELTKGDLVAALLLPNGQVAISGSLDRIDKGSILIKLDRLDDEHQARLEEYVTQLQMFDFVA